MNYLGHLYFSGSDLDLMHANLFGDFVKGRNLDTYIPIVRRGVLLHRQIDDYIDCHVEVRQLVRQLSPLLPKVAAVAVDLYFDHFLSVHWSKFHSTSLVIYLERFYHSAIHEHWYPNQQFLYLIDRIKKEKWLSGYNNLATIGRVCQGVSKRISFPNALIHGGAVLQNNYTLVENVFFNYMDDARMKFKDVLSQ